MKIAFISTYKPRECGIATFTENLIRSMFRDENGDNSAYVVAMDDRSESYPYPHEVKFSIRENHQKDYLKAADFINHNTDVCVLQHEFGIFGGNRGVYILPLLHRLKVPLVVTLHTVLKNPGFSEKAIINEIGRQAAKIIVMNRLAVTFLKESYEVDPDKIEVIEHGFPAFDFSQHDRYKQKYHLNNKISMMTFGLLSRGKGIETVIRALPEVVKKHSEVEYLVLGKTHPNVVKNSGEEYRYFLKRMVSQLHLENNVRFIDTFLNEEELCEHLAATDIYITPYPNEAQITSGTLAYAVGAGTAVVSTPYWHARELLQDNRGILFPFNDFLSLEQKLNELLDHPEKLQQIRKNAFEYGKNVTWPKQGEKYLETVETVVKNHQLPVPTRSTIIDPALLPKFRLLHLKRLTDSTGILQHARYHIPNYHHGYCLDDNARALLVMSMAYNRHKEKEALDLISIYLAFIQYMQRDDGRFRNFLSYDRQFLDEYGSEDAFGRTIWALGYLIAHAPNDAYFQLAKSLFQNSIQQFTNLISPRGIANTLFGIRYYLDRFPYDEGMMVIMKQLADQLTQAYARHKTDDWHWFEPILAYDNGLLPASLLHVYKKTEDETYRSVAEESMQFLESIVFKEDHLSLVGNQYWYRKGQTRSQYDQQPIDAMAMVVYYNTAYEVLGHNESYLKKMIQSFMWFMGENDLRVPLYDFETKGCCDGLEQDGVNRNQGAESMLAYLLSHLSVLIAFERESSNEIK